MPWRAGQKAVLFSRRAVRIKRTGFADFAGFASEQGKSPDGRDGVPAVPVIKPPVRRLVKMGTQSTASLPSYDGARCELSELSSLNSQVRI